MLKQRIKLVKMFLRVEMSIIWNTTFDHHAMSHNFSAAICVLFELMYRIEGTLNTRLSYDSTFYSPTIRYHIPSNRSLQKGPESPPSLSVIRFQNVNQQKITTNNCAINRIWNNTALDSSGHAPLKINVLNFYSLPPLFRRSSLVKLKFTVCN